MVPAVEVSRALYKASLVQFFHRLPLPPRLRRTEEVRRAWPSRPIEAGVRVPGRAEKDNGRPLLSRVEDKRKEPIFRRPPPPSPPATAAAAVAGSLRGVQVLGANMGAPEREEARRELALFCLKILPFAVWLPDCEVMDVLRFEEEEEEEEEDEDDVQEKNNKEVAAVVALSSGRCECASSSLCVRLRKGSWRTSLRNSRLLGS